MPSVTSLSQYAFSNVGPLTTTWTAPQSCATSTDVYLAPTESPDVVFIGSTCGIRTEGNCYPGGATQFDEILTINANMRDGVMFPYYSPGLHCPDKYTTAGIAVKDGDGKLVSSSGLFAPTMYGTYTIGPGPMTVTETETDYRGRDSPITSTTTMTTTFAPLYNPGWNVFMEALGPSETAVACCLSGYTVNFGGGCYSHVPRSMYTASTACGYVGKLVDESDDNLGYTEVNVTFVYAGATVTAEQQIHTGTKTATAMLTTDIFPISTDAVDYTGLVFAPIATLVHKASDNAGSRAAAGCLAKSVAVLTIAALIGLR